MAGKTFAFVLAVLLSFAFAQDEAGAFDCTTIEMVSDPTKLDTDIVFSGVAPDAIGADKINIFCNGKPEPLNCVHDATKGKDTVVCANKEACMAPRVVVLGDLGDMCPINGKKGEFPQATSDDEAYFGEGVGDAAFADDAAFASEEVAYDESAFATQDDVAFASEEVAYDESAFAAQDDSAFAHQGDGSDDAAFAHQGDGSDDATFAHQGDGSDDAAFAHQGDGSDDVAFEEVSSAADEDAFAAMASEDAYVSEDAAFEDSALAFALEEEALAIQDEFSEAATVDQNTDMKNTNTNTNLPVYAWVAIALSIVVVVVVIVLGVVAARFKKTTETA